MASPKSKLTTPMNPNDKRFQFESSIKLDNFYDFRELCMNFRSAKHKPKFEEELSSPGRQNSKKAPLNQKGSGLRSLMKVEVI